MAVIKIGEHVKITFQSGGDTSITTLETGTVCLYMQDQVDQVGVYTLRNVNQIPEELAEQNKEYLKLAFNGRPYKVIAVVQEGSAESMTIDTSKFKILETLSFDYLAFPGIGDSDTEKIVTWVQGINESSNHRFTCVLPNTDADDMHIINFANESITINGKVYTTAQATAYVAAEIAATVPMQSMTLHTANVDACSEMSISEINAAGDAGKLVLFNDGNGIKFASDANSMTTVDPTNQDENYQDIRCVAIMDLFYNSAKIQMLDKYIGKYGNSYQRKIMVVGAVFDLLRDFERTELCEKGDTDVILDVDAQTQYLRSINYKTKDGRGVDDMTQDEILRGNTRKKVFLKVRMIPLPAIESIEMAVHT